MENMIVTAKRAKDGLWTLKGICPHCGKKHTHGGGTGREPLLGHRVAHCGQEGRPNNGYMLIIDIPR